MFAFTFALAYHHTPAPSSDLRLHTAQPDAAYEGTTAKPPGARHMAKLNVNGKAHDYQADPGTPLLWVLREQLGMTGTKYGCGVAQCGACTVLIDGVPTRSCVVPEIGRAHV